MYGLGAREGQKGAFPGRSQEGQRRTQGAPPKLTAMDESPQGPGEHDPHGEGGAPDYARPEARSRRPWLIPAIVGVVVLIVGAIFGVKALAGGGSSSSTSTAGQAQGNRGQGNPARRGTVGNLQSIDGSTLTVATFARGGNAGGASNGAGNGATAGGGTTTVITNGSTKFYKTVNGSLSDVKVGDRVTAMGTPAGTNAVTAARITDTGTMADTFGGPGGGGAGRFRNGNGNGNGGTGSTPSSNPNVTRPDPNSFANGTVKTIAGSTLTVAQQDGTTKTVDTTGSTAVSVLKAVSINDLTTGQVVVVRGATNSDGTVTATNVVQGVGGFGGGGRFGGRFGGGGDNGQPPATNTQNGNGSTTQ